MHEFSLAERILECALEVSGEHGGAAIERVVLEIGALRAVVPESLKFAFEAASMETAAEGALLEWREIPAEVECRSCLETYCPQDIVWCCPGCGATGGRAVRGDELIITSVSLSDTPCLEGAIR
ncbi:MAG: hydrogenase maturation nickel metallochaperone HypA [Candidatus Hydrogenedentes bacterium]|nr:hydrogenase maturation nickel metallochaperone HypA [Candidatus Hydrogenedentota bacterium]